MLARGLCGRAKRPAAFVVGEVGCGSAEMWGTSRFGSPPQAVVARVFGGATVAPRPGHLVERERGGVRKAERNIAGPVEGAEGAGRRVGICSGEEATVVSKTEGWRRVVDAQLHLSFRELEAKAPVASGSAASSPWKAKGGAWRQRRAERAPGASNETQGRLVGSETAPDRRRGVRE